MEVLKTCTYCNNSKTLDCFRKQSKNKDGLKYVCISCDDLRAKERYLNLKESIVKKVRAWQSINKDKVKVYKKKYLEKRKTSDIINNA